MIIEDIVLDSIKHASDFKVIDLCVGLRYTYTVVKAGDKVSIGLAYTPLEDVGSCKLPIRYPSRENLVEMARSINLVEKSIAIAVSNAISNMHYEPPRDSINKDLLDKLEVKPSDNVLFIGYIGPLIARVRKVGCKVYVVERNPLRRRDALPDTVVYRLLPESNKIIITGSSIINETIDFILDEAPGNSIKAVVGATAACNPEVLFKHGVDYIASFKPYENRINEIIKCVKMALGTKEIYKYGVKYTVSKTV